MRLFDSNILIYAAQPQYAFLRRWLAEQDGAISAISVVEVLGFSGISPEQESFFATWFAQLEIIALDDAVLRRATQLRRQYRMKLGDCLVAGSAMERDYDLVTRNVQDFTPVIGLRVINPFPSDPRIAR